MPTYEYRCERGHEYEIEQRIVDEPLARCEQPVRRRDRLATQNVPCDAPVRRLISRTSFVLNGGGWSKEGYSK